MYKYTLIVGKTAIKKSQPLKLTPLGTVLLALFDSGENFIDAKTYFLSNKKKQRFEWVYTEPYCYAEVTVLAYKE